MTVRRVLLAVTVMAVGFGFYFVALVLLVRLQATDFGRAVKIDDLSKQFFQTLVGGAAAAVFAYLLRERTERAADERNDAREIAKDTVQTVDRPALDRVMALNQALDAQRRAGERLLGRIGELKQYARALLAWKMALLVSIWFSIAQFVGGAVQVGIDLLNRRAEIPAGIVPISHFGQSLILLAAAVILPMHAYRQFLRRAHSGSRTHLFRIGFLGLFVAGFISVFHLLSPEQLGVKEWWEGVPGLGVPHILFVLGSRLIVFPLLGMTACVLLRTGWVSRPVPGRSSRELDTAQRIVPNV
jgi:hypothetical protein